MLLDDDWLTAFAFARAMLGLTAETKKDLHAPPSFNAAQRHIRNSADSTLQAITLYAQGADEANAIKMLDANDKILTATRHSERAEREIASLCST